MNLRLRKKIFNLNNPILTKMKKKSKSKIRMKILEGGDVGANINNIESATTYLDKGVSRTEDSTARRYLTLSYSIDLFLFHSRFILSYLISSRPVLSYFYLNLF